MPWEGSRDLGAPWETPNTIEFMKIWRCASMPSHHYSCSQNARWFNCIPFNT